MLTSRRSNRRRTPSTSAGGLLRIQVRAIRARADTTFEDLDKQRSDKDKEVQDKFEAIGTTITELESQLEAQRAQDESQREARAKEID